MTSSSWRSAVGVRTTLVAALVGAAGIGGYGFASESLKEDAVIADGGNGTETSEETVDPTPFTTADAGSCLTWSQNEDGDLENFERADCDTEHHFEVSTREDLATYPASEFGADAERPGITRQAQLREELCHSATLRYLDGNFDPAGRYSIASILPPEDKWKAGDRTLLCGLQSTDPEGTVLETVGYVADQDQARTFEPGTCVAVDSTNQLTTVDCGEPHQLETTEVVDLREKFPDEAPSVEDQDKFLNETCTQAAMDFLGDEEALYQSTLQPYWIPIQPASWAGGSHSTNCYLVHANDDDGFSELAGSATDRESFTIDGNPPEEQPEREPRRDAEPGEGAANPGGEQPPAAPQPDANADPNAGAIPPADGSQPQVQ